jgi:hypothetical protein
MGQDRIEVGQTRTRFERILGVEDLWSRTTYEHWGINRNKIPTPLDDVAPKKMADFRPGQSLGG